MSGLTVFESRYGKASCSAEELFRFVTDLRNFARFINNQNINNWNADKDSCSFSVPMVGNVKMKIAEKEEFKKVVYEGDALKKNDFSILLKISDDIKSAGINVILTTDLNPMMKMLAVKPIGQFLEMLINEMEKFRDWKNVNE